MAAKRRLLRSLAALLVAVLSACTVPVDTSPDTFNVPPRSLIHLAGMKGVALENAYKADAPEEIRMGQSTWVVDRKKMTDTAIVMLRRALEKQGPSAAPEAGRTMTLRVHAPSAIVVAYPFYAQTTAGLMLDAEFDDGTRTSVFAENRSPMSGQRAFEGAILFALNRLLVDERFVAYMKK
jgi:hypothetical protein